MRSCARGQGAGSEPRPRRSISSRCHRVPGCAQLLPTMPDALQHTLRSLWFAGSAVSSVYAVVDRMGTGHNSECSICASALESTCPRLRPARCSHGARCADGQEPAQRSGLAQWQPFCCRGWAGGTSCLELSTCTAIYTTRNEPMLCRCRALTTSTQLRLLAASLHLATLSAGLSQASAQSNQSSQQRPCTAHSDVACRQPE